MVVDVFGNGVGYFGGQDHFEYFHQLLRLQNDGVAQEYVICVAVVDNDAKIVEKVQTRGQLLLCLDILFMSNLQNLSSYNNRKMKVRV